MKRRSSFLGLFLVFMVVAAIGHASIHLTFYGTGYEGFAKKGLTGMAVESTETEEGGFQFSGVVLFLEWALIFLGAVFVYARYKVSMKKEFDNLSLLRGKKHFERGTELDKFYALLKDTGHFRLSNAARVFDVDYEVIEDWAHSLEGAEVAELTYPRVGGPEIHIIEERKNKEANKN